MSGGQTPNIVDIRSEVAEIKKIVVELYEISVVTKPIVEIVISTLYVPNIWVVPVDAIVEETEE